MTSIGRLGLLLMMRFVALFGLGLMTVEADESIDGGKIFQTSCLACHSGALLEAPKVEALKLYPPERIVTSLESGLMSTAGMALSRSEKTAVAEYLTGKKVTKAGNSVSTYTCKSTEIATPSTVSNLAWNGWGGQSDNSRHQQDAAWITADNVSDLKLKWTFAFPDATRVRAQPTVTDNMVYIGSQAGIIYALDANTGCVHWEYQAKAEVRGAIFVQNDLLLFGDLEGNAYAINAISGKLLWRTKVHQSPLAVVTGSVIADASKVYVPVSSLEIIPAARPDYECCSFRGAVVAIDIQSGEKVWTTYTVDEPKATYKTSVGTQQHGPSGAPVWSGPTLDLERNLLYATTGQNYSSPATGTSDAVLALDLESGEIKWVTQVTKGDAWNGACSRNTPNCPKEDGPDYDIGASAILSKQKNGKQLLIVGQKSGMVYALDPDAQGKVVWKKRVGSGGTMGGVHWGMSTSTEKVFVGVSDLPTNNAYNIGDAHPGIHSLDLKTGEFVWRKTLPNVCPKERKFLCFPGISAAVSSSADLVYAGSLDGMFRIFSASNGDILWEYNTTQAVIGNNGVKGYGGSIEADGPVIANKSVYLTSGYDKWGEAPGNLLMVFSIGGQ
ncbi:outer membrane protein assembly factor BamB family protein [Paraglaciecola arctica]|uniref:outer membrane protein assembly factor BamB family protein n=1 Tax=Paraglaciecola arctica TaxID=1128911 RepID=UPI001C071469|nr:PQQ-binding-like beta-propeller repeat protein [Paraglaciecola arctica]MBU3003407.1 PQQ-binding-like beta-propeller repeat protein [Paraglaciecola arctica]